MYVRLTLKLKEIACKLIQDYDPGRMADRFIRFILCKKHMLFLKPRFAIAVAVVQRAFKTAMITSTLLYYVT